MIEVSNLNLTIAKKSILRNINLSIAPQQVTAILGPNGAGKTSLLKCLSGDPIHYGGEIRLNRRLIKDYSLAELAKHRAVLSQSNPITFPFTAMEIVMMGRNPYLTNTSIKQDIAIAEQALNEVDAYQFKDRLFLTLSGGEQQRVQLARVLTQIWEQQDAILFLDEPTSALDLKHQHQILELARTLSVERLMTVICILHDINLATHYTDQAILMLDGEIYKNGNSKEMLCTENIQHVYQLSDTIIDKFHSYNPQTA